jgi:hypothetical protein
MSLKNIALVLALLSANPNVEAQENYKGIKIDLGTDFNCIENPVKEWGSRLGIGVGLESRTKYANFDAGLYAGLKQSYLKNLGSARVPLYDSDGVEFGANAGISINLPWDFSVSSNTRFLQGFYFAGNPENNGDLRPSWQIDSNLLLEKSFKINDNISLRAGAGIFELFFSGSVKGTEYSSNDFGGEINFAIDLLNKGNKAMSFELDGKFTPDEYDDGEIRGAVGFNMVSYFPTL